LLLATCLFAAVGRQDAERVYHTPAEHRLQRQRGQHTGAEADGERRPGTHGHAAACQNGQASPAWWRELQLFTLLLLQVLKAQPLAARVPLTIENRVAVSVLVLRLAVNGKFPAYFLYVI
jgi:hypothetical protein